MLVVDFSTLSFESYIQCSVFLIVLLVLIFKGERQNWLAVDTVASVGFGVFWILFPNFFLGIQVVGDVDPYAATLARLFGCVLVASAVVWIISQEALDGTVPITLMTARVFSCSVLLLCQLYSLKFTPATKGLHWSQQDFTVGMFGNVIWLLGNIYFLFRSHDFSTYPQFHVRINEFLRLDALFSLLLAVCLIAFPDLLTSHFFPGAKGLGGVHQHLVRATGCLYLNLAIISLQAPGFLHERHKRAQFTGVLVTHLLALAPFVWGALYGGQFTLWQVEVALLVLLPLLINGTLGYMAGGTIYYRYTASKTN